MDRLRRAQPEARAEFFRRYAPQVRRILFLQGFCEEVDDAVQEVFIKVYRPSSRPRRRSSPGSTASSSTRGATTAAGARRGSDCSTSSSRSPRTGPWTRRPDPSDPALREALAGLSPELRECVALRFFADLPLEEIATAQDIPVGTVKSRLHGAVKRLRTTLIENGFEHDA